MSEANVSYKIVLMLLEPYVNFGRCLFIDNWYSSVELEEKRLEKKYSYGSNIKSKLTRKLTCCHK